MGILLSSTFSVEDLRLFIQDAKIFYDQIGVFAAIALPYIETLFPFLPLFLMLAFNILKFGLVIGYILTYIGTVLGTLSIFFFMRYVSSKRFKEEKKHSSKVSKYYHWVEETHPLTHIVVLMVPLSPTFWINYSMGLTKIPFKTFIFITLVSRAFLLFICIPFGMTLLTLMNEEGSGSVHMGWLTVTGVVVLGSVVFGQVMKKKISINQNNQKMS